MSVVVFDEIPGARRSNSNPPYFEMTYLCAGIFDSGTVKSSALNLTAPLVATTEGILFRDNIAVEELGARIYHVIVSYAEKKNETGQFTFRFSTTGGTLHISHSPYPTHEIYNKSGGTIAKDIHKQAIDPDPNDGMKPRGTEIVIPACKFTYGFKHPTAVVNEAFAIALARLTGTVNSVAWHGLAAGEAMYMGSEGSDGSNAEAEVTYEIVAQENLTGLVIGGITGIAKEGHDFLWVWWEPDIASNQPATKPKAVFIERLHRRVNFAASFGF